MRALSLVCLTLLLPALVACGPDGDPTGQKTPKTEAAVQPETAPVEPQARVFWFEPAALSACGKPTKIVINWDVSSIEGVRAVDIIAVGAKHQERPFLAAGRSGSRETGEWMQAGSLMILRNRADSAELARVKVGSIPCD